MQRGVYDLGVIESSVTMLPEQKLDALLARHAAIESELAHAS